MKVAKKDPTRKGASEANDDAHDENQLDLIDDQLEPEEIEAAQESEQEDRPKSQRELAMEQIHQKRREEIEKEMGEAVQATEAEEPEPEPKNPEQDQAPVFQKDGQWMMRIKVNGADQEIPYQQALATLQKQESAEIRLREAATERKKLEAEKAALLEKERQLQAKLSEIKPPEKGADALSNKDVQEEAKGLIEAIYAGEEEEAVNRLAKLAAANPQVNFDNIINDVETRVMSAIDKRTQELEQQRKQSEINTARQAFNEEFSDIANDPVKFAIADQICAQLEQENPDLPAKELFRQVGVKTREWLGTNSTDTATKTERKKALPQDTPVGAKASPGKEPPAPKTTAEIIEELRRARGQVM